MSLVAVELNDVGVFAATHTRSEQPSPGYALVRGNQMALGMGAYRQARLYPRDTHHRFWHELSTEIMPVTHDLYQSRADLAYLHLQSVLEPFQEDLSNVMFAVPGSFSRQQLGLLLGIAKELGVQVTGLVDSALAAVAHPIPGDRILLLDATLHSALLTRFDVSNGLHRTEVVRIDNVGLNDLRQRWANCIGDAFVKNSRFDPMHSAQSEQWLYDHMDAYLEQFNAGESQVEVISEDGKFSTGVERAMLVSSVAGLYQPIVTAVISQARTDSVTTLLLTSRTASLPGLRTLLEENPFLRVQALEANAATRHILANPDVFATSENGITLKTDRPWQATPSLVSSAGPAESSVASEPEGASHLLVDDQAYHIDEKQFVLGTSLPPGQWGYQINGPVKGISRVHCTVSRTHGQIVLEDRSTYGTFVNGKRVAAQQVLHTGDTIQIGNPGITIRAIRQVRTNGAN